MTSDFIVKKIQQIKNVVNCLEFSKPNSDHLEKKLHTMMNGTALRGHVSKHQTNLANLQISF